MSKRLRRPSHATVVAYLALFVALGGTASANRHLLIGGHDIRAHSITSRDLARGSVTARAIRHGAVTAPALRPGAITTSALGPQVVANLEAQANQIDGSRIKDGTITAAKLAAGSVTGDAVAPGSLPGDRLVAGTVTNTQLASDVTAGVRGWQLVEDTSPTAKQNIMGGTATCPAGTQALGGGIRPGVISTDPALSAAQGDPEFILDDGPSLNADGSSAWTGMMVWNGGADPKGSGWNVTVYAVCGQTHPRTGLTAP